MVYHIVPKLLIPNHYLIIDLESPPAFALAPDVYIRAHEQNKHTIAEDSITGKQRIWIQLAGGMESALSICDKVISIYAPKNIYIHRSFKKVLTLSSVRGVNQVVIYREFDTPDPSAQEHEASEHSIYPRNG